MGIEEFPTIKISQGVLRGQRVLLKNGGYYFSFQGIPYAKPPVGPRRFKVAEPPELWHGVRDALQEGNSCPQIEYFFNRPYRGDEDCLYLNVYSPKLSSINERVRKPVMVWIHGGAFEAGSGDSDIYGPQYLVAEDVVLVTINYRLHIFGFLSLDDPSQPDNLGLKDQVAALRWVQANIEVFGGDASNVTIFGESAGGASVHYHMLSPMSKGLFHKAIMQSGCALNPWATCENPKKNAFKVAAALGCKTTSIQELLKFLSDVPAKVLVDTLDKLRVEGSTGELLRFGPVPELHVKPGEEIFLPALPRELMDNSLFSSVPCILGVTSHESIAFLGLLEFHRNPELIKYYIDNMETQIPKDPITKLNQKELAVSLKSFYFKNNNSPSASLDAILNLLTDAWFTRGVDRTLKQLSSKSSSVFCYNFSFSGERNLIKTFVKATSLKGASHFDELGYLFESPFFNVSEAKPESRELKTLKRLVTMWTNFAKMGHPTPNLDDTINVRWPPYTTTNPIYLNIDDKLSVGWDMNGERMAFWNKL